MVNMTRKAEMITFSLPFVKFILKKEKMKMLQQCHFQFNKVGHI